jgi:hypothetical protein
VLERHAQRTPARAGAGTKATPTRWWARAALGLAAAAAPLVLWASSCALNGFERVGPGSGGGSAETPDSGTTGSMIDASTDAPVGCVHATYPELPQGQDGDADIEFVVAIRSVDFGEETKAAERLYGLDLDKECTCSGGRRTCQPRTGDAPHCDGPGGRDIASADLFKSLQLVAPELTSSAYSQSIEDGNWSLLLRVRHYDGQENDSSVTLDWYVTTSFSMQNGSARPAWNGEDRWPLSSAGLTSPDGGTFSPDSGYDGVEHPRYTSASAYVSSGVLVAPFSEIELNLVGRTHAAIKIKTSGATLMGRIEKQDGPVAGYALRQGIIAGRWTEQEIFRALSSYRRSDGSAVCTNKPYYAAGKRTFCRALDINEVEGPTSRPCDALSIGVGFEAFPALLGDSYLAVPETPGCPAAQDPLYDTCSQ